MLHQLFHLFHNGPLYDCYHYHTVDSRDFFPPEEIPPPKDTETPVESPIPISPSSSVGSSSPVRSTTPPPGVDRMAPKRTSTSAAPPMTQAAIKKQLADSVAVALEAQAATMARTVRIFRPFSKDILSFHDSSPELLCFPIFMSFAMILYMFDFKTYSIARAIYTHDHDLHDLPPSHGVIEHIDSLDDDNILDLESDLNPALTDFKGVFLDMIGVVCLFVVVAAAVV
ncbi:hypothetical protein Tco_0684792, partial [Tanacetum coccineum]